MERNYSRGSENSLEFIFLTCKDRVKLAQSVVAILPALFNMHYGQCPKGWFHAQAQNVIHDVTMDFDQETTEWTGTWTTQADEDMEELLAEDYGMGLTHIEFDNLALLDEQQPIRMALQYPGDNMSGGTSVGTTPWDATLGQTRPEIRDSQKEDDASSISSSTSHTSVTRDINAQQQAASEAPAVNGEAGHLAVAGGTGQ